MSMLKRRNGVQARHGMQERPDVPYFRTARQGALSDR